MREVVSETENPVMLYSVGKDSVVKPHFAKKACYPLTGAVQSEAATLTEVIQEMLLTTTSERQGCAIDKDQGASMEVKKQQGYF